jgi:hypothetical protein
MPQEAWRDPGNGVHEAGPWPNFMNRFMQTNKHGVLLWLMLINLNRR